MTWRPGTPAPDLPPGSSSRSFLQPAQDPGRTDRTGTSYAASAVIRAHEWRVTCVAPAGPSCSDRSPAGRQAPRREPVNDITAINHANDSPHEDGPRLRTPYTRLRHLIEAGGTYTLTAYDELLGSHDAAAVIRCGRSIASSPRLSNEQTRCEVLAMAIAVASTAPAGTVIIRTERDPDADRDTDRVTTGLIATMLARHCGLETASAAFRWQVADLPASQP
jgi:hypothetical protein